MPPIGPSSELTHAGRPYELTLLVSTVLVLNTKMSSFGVDAFERDTRQDHDVDVDAPKQRPTKVWHGLGQSVIDDTMDE